jgi:hypothetical protein
LAAGGAGSCGSLPATEIVGRKNRPISFGFVFAKSDSFGAGQHGGFKRSFVFLSPPINDEFSEHREVVPEHLRADEAGRFGGVNFGKKANGVAA